MANPHRFLACPLRKFGLAPTPLRLFKPPVGVPSGTEPRPGWRGLARPTVAVVQLADRLRTAGRICITLFGLAPTPLRLCKTPIGVPSGIAEAARCKASRRALNKFSALTKLGRDLPMTGRSFAPRRPAFSRLRSSGPRKLRPEKRLGPTVSGRAPFSAMPPRRGGRAGRLPLGRDAQRLLLPASTLSETSRASDPRK